MDFPLVQTQVELYLTNHLCSHLGVFVGSSTQVYVIPANSSSRENFTT